MYFIYICVSVPKECACVIPNLSAKQCDWLSHARPAPFSFPLFLFPGSIVNKYCTRPISKHLYSGIFKDPLGTKYETFKNRLNS